MRNNRNLDLVITNAYPKCDQIPSVDKNHGSSRAITLLLFDENWCLITPT